MFKKFIENKKLGGINCLVWKNQEVLFQESFGYKNLETKELMNIDTIFRISSMTKPITSVLALKLYEENKIKLSDPISKWFPEFQNMKVIKNKEGDLEKAKRNIRIEDLLTHRAGFTYGEFQTGKLKEEYKILGRDIDSELGLKEWVKRLSSLPLLSQPGELFNYGRSTDLLGIIISHIEEKPLGKVMEEKLLNPLLMNDTFFEVPDIKRNRCASNFGFDEKGKLMNLKTVPLNMAFKNRPKNLEFESGGQGLWSTINDYLKFSKIFVENGSSNDVQILKKDTIDLMCKNHLTFFQRENSLLMNIVMFKENFGFGLGLAVVNKENRYNSIPCAGSVGSVGWPGAYGGWWSADPIKKSIAIFLTHSMTEPNQLAEGIGFELYEAIEIFANFYKKIV